MADKKRKTLQIKRPGSTPPSKKKPLPKVNMDEKAATSSIDTDDLTSLGPTPKKDSNSGKTTRIALPDEEKLKKARRANVTQDLEEEGALPSADQISRAQNNATMPIMIDTENVSESQSKKLEEAGNKDDADRTMEIDPDALATGNIDTGNKDDDPGKDRTMQIDPEALATGKIDSDTEEADPGKDRTMQIDPDSLATGNLEEEMAEAGKEKQSDQTLEIDENELEEQLTSTGKMDQVGEQDLQSMETMRMDDVDGDSEAAQASESEDSGVTLEEMKESFNAQTMAMDPGQLEEELSEPESAEQDEESDELSKTMDLSEGRPKTIMIKRPNKPGASPNTPTVKAVRPDAATVRSPRPKTGSPSSAKEDTSRIDVPGQKPGEGKTIKLRRPAGGPGRSAPSVSRVSSGAGLQMNADGSVSRVRKTEELSASWLAVAIVTTLISLGAVWTLWAHINAELPMPGRLVNEHHQVIEANL